MTFFWFCHAENPVTLTVRACDKAKNVLDNEIITLKAQFYSLREGEGNHNGL
jgi:hypothetical protein